MSQRFDILRERLLKAGVAPRHVRRYLRELSDHVADFVTAEEAAGSVREDAENRAYAMLGSDDALPNAMAARPEFRSISSRAPWLVFGVFPPVFVILVMLIPVFALLPMLGPYVRITGHISIIPIWYRTAAALLCALENYGIGLLCALFFVGMAVRQRMTSLWPKVGCFVTAIAGAYTTTSVNFPKFDGDRSGEISLQVLTSLPLDHVVGRFLPTLLVATAAYYLLKDRSKRSTV